jgi:hypothetical protein
MSASTWALFVVFIYDGKIDTQQVRDIPTQQICIDMKETVSKPFVIEGKSGDRYTVGVAARCVERKGK